MLVIPAVFGATADPSTVVVLFNQGRPRESEVAQAIIRQILDDITFTGTETPRRFSLDIQGVETRNLRYVDFLMPGIVAMAIMQMGLFSVAFAFVQLKSRGILRRLLATPVHPVSFLFSQVFTRLTVSILQTLVLIGAALIFFDVQIAGNLAAILLLALMGGAVFVSMGFAISGWAKTEEVAAPLANVIALPMMFLSGVFFPRRRHARSHPEDYRLPAPDLSGRRLAEYRHRWRSSVVPVAEPDRPGSMAGHQLPGGSASLPVGVGVP